MALDRVRDSPASPGSIQEMCEKSFHYPFPFPCLSCISRFDYFFLFDGEALQGTLTLMSAGVCTLLVDQGRPASRSLGVPERTIAVRHMLPNVMAPYLIMLTAFLGQAILLEASLSFLGLGVQEPTAAWGLMLRGAAVEFAETAPWMALFPGLAISLAVFAFNLFGDSLRDWLDPKIKL